MVFDIFGFFQNTSLKLKLYFLANLYQANSPEKWTNQSYHAARRRREINSGRRARREPSLGGGGGRSWGGAGGRSPPWWWWVVLKIGGMNGAHNTGIVREGRKATTWTSQKSILRWLYPAEAGARRKQTPLHEIPTTAAVVVVVCRHGCGGIPTRWGGGIGWLLAGGRGGRSPPEFRPWFVAGGFGGRSPPGGLTFLSAPQRLLPLF